MTIKQQGGIFGRQPEFTSVTAGQINSTGAIIAFGAGSFGGDVDLAGNIILANGKGIDFSATSGTGTSELFDDYEEGTWTPTLVKSGGAISATYTSSGHYTKVGNLVFVSGEVNITAIASQSGVYPLITNLPYNSVNHVSYEVSGNVTKNSALNTFAVTKAMVGGANIFFGEDKSTGFPPLSTSYSVGSVAFSIVYQTS